jgi:hypothetical protein
MKQGQIAILLVLSESALLIEQLVEPWIDDAKPPTKAKKAKAKRKAKRQTAK